MSRATSGAPATPSPHSMYPLGWTASHPVPQAWPTRCDVGECRCGWGVGVVGKLDHVIAVERARRDARVVKLFLAGASYRDICAVVGLRSPQSVGNIVARELSGSAQRRDLLTDEAFAVWQERSERLFRAHWGRALDGNYRSAELCRKLLGQQAQVYGLAREVSLIGGTPAGVVEVEPDMDELARLRAKRAGA